MRPRIPIVVIVVSLFLMVGLCACAAKPTTPPSPTAAPAAESTPPPREAATDIRLTVDGQPFDGAALRDLEVTKTVETPKGEEATYTGIGLRALLHKVNIADGAITLVASDGYASEVAVADVNDDCLLAYNDDGGLDAVMPGLGGGAWVKDVVEITVGGATAEAEAETEAEAEPVISINGQAFTQDDLEALEQLSQDIDGRTYQGVRILDALEAAGVTSGTITMTASDGYSANVDVATLTPACLLAYADDGTVGAVFPGMDKGLWVKMLAEISVEGATASGGTASEPEIPADAILVVNGKPFTLADLQAFPQVEQEIDGKTYQGVSLLEVLEAAGITEGSILMTASDGYAAGVSIDALSPECLLAYESGGTVGSVLPGISRGSWVKMLATITIDEGAPSSAEPLPTRVKPTTGETRVVVDSLGKEVTIPAHVSAVASMRSGTTEIICALGQVDKIIAVDEMVKAGESYGEFIASIHPELMERAAPFRNRDISAEEMLRLNPDVVLHGGYGRIAQAEALQKQVPDMPIVIAHFETIEDYMNDIRIVAQCVNAEEAAERLIATLQGTLDFVTERVKDIPESEKVRVFYGGHDIYKAYTGTTFEHAQIVMAGGINVAADLEGWHPEVSAEQLLVWDPEVIIVLNGVDVDAILADPKVQGVSAIKNRRVYSLPEASWDFSSPRALFCIEWLAQILYPERFADIDIDAEADAFYRAVFGVDYTGPKLGSGLTATSETRIVTDMIGRKVEVPRHIARAMPLSSDITASLMALGVGDRLAAVDSMTPANANLMAAFPELADKSAPCAFFDANAESILAVNPDVVLTVSWQRDPDKLQEMMGIPVVCIDLNLYAPTLRFLSELMGVEDRAGEIVGYYQERMATIRATLRDLSPDERARVYVAGNDMMSTYGAESTWHYEILDAGGVNVAAALTGGGSHSVSMEQIMLWDPQVVVLDNACQDGVDDVLNDPRWAGISAVKEGRVFRASPGYVGPWGRPHLESAMARVWLADKLYPETLDLDIVAEAATFYERVYGRAFDDAELQAILGE